MEYILNLANIGDFFNITPEPNKLHALTELININHRQLALIIICSILSDLVYTECDMIFYTDVLYSLDLVIKTCYESDNNTKYMIVAKGTAKELNEIREYRKSSKDKIINRKKKLSNKKKEELEKTTNLEIQKLIKKNIIDRIIKLRKINDEFIKPYYNPKLDELLSKYLDFGSNSHIKNIITNDDLFIVFRGTCTQNNIISDLTIPLIKSDITLNNGKLHKGFTESYDSVKSKLEKTIKTYIEKPNLIITGHSLGGALATLATFDLNHKLKDYKKNHSIGLITLGGPRSTDQIASNYFTKILDDPSQLVKFNIRICNQYDPVVYYKPVIPPIYGYRHIISLITVNEQPQKFTSLVFKLNTQPLTQSVMTFYQNRYKAGRKTDTKNFLGKLGKNIITHFMGNYIINILINLPKKIYNKDIELNIDNLNESIDMLEE